MKPSVTAVIVWASQLGSWHVASERQHDARGFSASTVAREMLSPQRSGVSAAALVETSEAQQDSLELNLRALSQRIRRGDPLELTYPSYTHYGNAVAKRIDEIHHQVTHDLDGLAHRADMKSGKYGYGLDGLRSAMSKLQTSVHTYRKRMHTQFKDQTNSMNHELEGGKLWDAATFGQKLPPGVFHAGLLHAISKQSADDFSLSRHRQEALRANQGEEIVHPDTAKIFKMGYSHGYQNATEGHPHGLEGGESKRDINDMPKGWEAHMDENYHVGVGHPSKESHGSDKESTSLAPSSEVSSL